MDSQRVLITGGSSGMGKAAVEKFLLNGCSVVFVDVNEPMANELLAEHKAQAAQGRLHYFHGNISDEQDVINLVKYTNEKIGGCDVLVNNAGIFRGG